MPTAQLDKKKAPPSKDTSVAIDEVLPDDTNIAKVGINVADLDIKKIQISSPKKTSYDFDEEDKVWGYYTYIDNETEQEDGGEWLPAVILRKVCTTTQGYIGNGEFITYNKDTYIIKYDYDGQYDINRPTRMIQHRTEDDDSEPKDNSEPLDALPPQCFITLPDIDQRKEPPELLGKKKASSTSSTEPASKAKKKPNKKKNNNNKISVASGHIKSSAPGAIDKLIPDSFKACTTGWEEEDISKMPYRIMTEESYIEEYLLDSLLDTHKHVATSMGNHLQNKGLEVSAVNALTELIQSSTFEDIASHTTEELVKKGHAGVNGYELKRLFATKYLRSRFKVDVDTAWPIMKSLAAEKNFTLMDKHRYNNIMYWRISRWDC